MANIKIYGDIVPFKWFNDGTEVDLNDLKTSLDGLDMKEGEELTVDIHTFGGCTTTAFGMFNMLQRYKNEHKINLTTRVDGWCASSGVILLLAGDKRIGNRYTEPFVHNAWTWAPITDKKEAQKIMEDLTKVDDMIATLYADRTSIEKEKALELMDADTFLTPDQCLSYGFYTELENVEYEAQNALILNSIRIQRKNLNLNNMKNNKPKQLGIVDELKKLINSFTGGTSNKIVYTAENGELDFYELAEDATPVVGDKAKYDNKPAGDSNDGTYVMASGETYKFEGEELMEIIPASTEGDSPTVAELQDKVAELENSLQEKDEEIAALNKKVQTAEAIVNKFNSLDLSALTDEDEGEDDGNEPAPRNPKNKAKVVSTSSLWANIK